MDGNIIALLLSNLLTILSYHNVVQNIRNITANAVIFSKLSVGGKQLPWVFTTPTMQKCTSKTKELGIWRPTSRFMWTHILRKCYENHWKMTHRLSIWELWFWNKQILSNSKTDFFQISTTWVSQKVPKHYCYHTHTHTRLTVLFPGLPGWAGTSKHKILEHNEQ